MSISMAGSVVFLCLVENSWDIKLSARSILHKWFLLSMFTYINCLIIREKHSMSVTSHSRQANGAINTCDFV